MNTATKLWNKNFMMFVVGMEFNLIGSELLKFVLPLYVLLETGDPTLMGTVLALSSVPFIALTPVGGVIADRVNKRKLLGLMNLATAIAIFVYFALAGQLDIVPATVMMMLVLFAFESMISPSMEATVPALVPEGELVKANSATFLLTTISSIGAPIIGGFLLERFGVTPVLLISIACYVLAGMVKFLVRIPYIKQDRTESLSATIVTDIKDGLRCITKEKPELGKLVIIVALFGLTLAPSLSALNVIVTTHLGMAETMVGLIRGLIVVGGVVGVMLLGTLGEKANISMIRTLLFIASMTFVPVGLSLMWSDHRPLIFVVVVVSFFIQLASTTMMGIINWAHIGEKTPPHLIGKIYSLTFAFMGLGGAIGDYLYGHLLGHFIETPWMALFIIAGASAIVAVGAKIKE